MRKWEDVKRVYTRWRNLGGGKREGFVMHKNAPMFQEIRWHFEKAFNKDNHNITNEGMNAHGVRLYFEAHPNQRRHIFNAHRKLNAVHNQLNKVAHKIMAVRRIQKHWQKARFAKRKIASLVALKSLPANMKRIIISSAYPNPVFGPLTSSNWFKQTFLPGKYKNY